MSQERKKESYKDKQSAMKAKQRDLTGWDRMIQRQEEMQTDGDWAMSSLNEKCNFWAATL